MAACLIGVAACDDSPTDPGNTAVFTVNMVVDTGLTAAAAIPIANGLAMLTINNVNADPATVQSIIDNPAALYFNVHSTANPDGVVRGQLVRQGT